MADKQIIDLPESGGVTDETVFVVYQPGAIAPAQKATAAQLKTEIVAMVLDAIQATGNLSFFRIRFPDGVTALYSYDPDVCYDWNSFINSEYNTGRFYAGANHTGNLCVMTRWDTAGYVWYIGGTEQKLDDPIKSGTIYDMLYWVP